jgi:hypothetical protein
MYDKATDDGVWECVIRALVGSCCVRCSKDDCKKHREMTANRAVEYVRQIVAARVAEHMIGALREKAST